MRDQRIAELRALHFFRAVHEAGEIVGNDLVADRASNGCNDQIRRLSPAHVAQHHLTGEND